MKKVLALAIALILVVAVFAGCSKGGNDLVGKWAWEYEGIGEVMSFTFNADGTGSLDALGESESFTYTVSGNTLNMTVDGETESCPFSINGNTMTLEIEGEEIELVRK